MIYGADLALHALNLPVKGVKYVGVDTECTFCGRLIADGDIAEKAKFPKTFTDGPSLATKSGMSCGACSQITAGSVLNALRQYVLNADGFWSLAKDSNRVWFILTPPEPPFVAAVVNSNVGHTIWRTPVTMSQDLIYVRQDYMVHRIRRNFVLDAIPICERIAACIEQVKASKSIRKKVATPDPDKKERRNPFLALERKMNKLSHGVLSPHILENDMHGIKDEIDFLNELSPGELWILSSMVTANNPEPECTPLVFDPKGTAE